MDPKDPGHLGCFIVKGWWFQIFLFSSLFLFLLVRRLRFLDCDLTVFFVVSFA